MLSKKNKEALFNPLSKDNPVLIQILGICSALAVTASLEPAIVMPIKKNRIHAAEKKEYYTEREKYWARLEQEADDAEAMSGQVSRGSSGEYQADEPAGVARLSWRVSGR